MCSFFHIYGFIIKKLNNYIIMNRVFENILLSFINLSNEDIFNMNHKCTVS